MTKSSRPASRYYFWPRDGHRFLINKLRHGPADDWNNDLGDVRNLVSIVSADWKHLIRQKLRDIPPSDIVVVFGR